MHYIKQISHKINIYKSERNMRRVMGKEWRNFKKQQMRVNINLPQKSHGPKQMQRVIQAYKQLRA